MILLYHALPTAVDYRFREVARKTPVVGVQPHISAGGFAIGRRRVLREDPFPVVRIDLPQGYRDKSFLFPLVAGRLARVRPWCEKRYEQSVDTVVFTAPEFAPLARRFPDCRRVYLVRDDYREYPQGGEWVPMREEQMLEAVDLVFCVSAALRQRFIEHYGARQDRVHVLPNATRAETLPPEPLTKPLPLPAVASGLQRPVAGLIGNLGVGTDFGLLMEVARRTPWLSWLLVGPLKKCDDAARVRARDEFLSLKQVRHVGKQPYESLHLFARALDVAIIAYAPGGMTPFRSPVKMFDYLAATRPIISLAGCPQCEEYVPLLSIANSAEEMAAMLCQLRDVGFDDGLAQRRLAVASENTWQVRAERFLSIVYGFESPAECKTSIERQPDSYAAGS